MRPCYWRRSMYLLVILQVKSIFQVGFFTNRMFLYAVGGSLMGQMLVIYFPPLQAVFLTEALHCTDILLLVCVASSVFLVDEIRKMVLRTIARRKQPPKDFQYYVWQRKLSISAVVINWYLVFTFSTHQIIARYTEGKQAPLQAELASAWTIWARDFRLVVSGVAEQHG